MPYWHECNKDYIAKYKNKRLKRERSHIKGACKSNTSLCTVTDCKIKGV